MRVSPTLRSILAQHARITYDEEDGIPSLCYDPEAVNERFEMVDIESGDLEYFSFSVSDAQRTIPLLHAALRDPLQSQYDSKYAGSSAPAGYEELCILRTALPSQWNAARVIEEFAVTFASKDCRFVH